MKINEMSKTGAIVFIAAFCCLLFIVLALKSFLAVPALNENFADLQKTRSDLEARNYEQFPDLTFEHLVDGEFQQGVDNHISDSVPFRDEMLLTSSWMQRIGIRTSNLIFGFDEIPTYYGSGVGIDESNQTLFAFPTKMNQGLTDSIEDAVKAYNNFTKMLPDDVNVYMYNPLQAQKLVDGPYDELIRNSFNETMLNRMFHEKLQGLTVIDSSCTLEEHLSDWYRTDHHWSAEGAYKGYDKIAQSMGIEDRVPIDRLETFDEPLFYGTQARLGRCVEISDRMRAFAFDLKYDKLSINGEESDFEDLLHLYLYRNREWSESLFENRYAELFHVNKRIISMRNDSARKNSGLLIVGDSYSNCIAQLFSGHYRYLDIVDVRYKGASIEKFLEDRPYIHDVLFLMFPENIISETTTSSLMEKPDEN